MCGNTHNNTGAIRGEYIVPYPKLHFLAVQRIDSIQSGKNAVFLACFRLAFNLRFGNRPGDIFIDRLLSLRRDVQACHHVRLRSNRHKGHAKDGIRPCGEHWNLDLRILNLESDLTPDRLADPVSLHGLDAIRPPIKAVKTFEQSLSIVGDAEIPLIQSLLANDVMAAPASAV